MFNLNRLWKSFGKSRRDRDRPAKIRTHKPALERLDDRRVMAASLGFSGSELTITADSAGSQVVVTDLNPLNQSTLPPLLLISTTSPNGSWTTAFPKLGVQQIKFIGSNQNDTFSTNAGFRFVGQYYPYLYQPIIANLNGYGGHDTLTGGMGNDTIDGGSGNDRLYGDYAWNHFTDSDPTNSSYQWGGADTISGGPDNDEIHGGGGDDDIHGDAGDDHLYGGYGNDLIHGDQDWDWLYGQYGNDKVVGGGGTDFVYGGSGNDSVYGGYGTDWLDGGAGADRILVHRSAMSNDTVYFPTSQDATMYFEDGVTDYKLLGSNIGWVKAYGKQWSEAEIEQVDDAFGELTDFTGNTALLKSSSGLSMTFERFGSVRNATQNADGSFTLGAINGSVGGWNGDRTIAFTNNRMLAGESEIHRVVFHELGHNWDDAAENSFATSFRAVAGWRTFPTGWLVGPAYEQAQDDNWSNWYFINRDTGLDGFARNYGKMNPKEDFATSFAAYMMSRTSRNYNGETPAQIELRLDARFDVLDDFFASLGATV